jgi:hypothetical protein
MSQNVQGKLEHLKKENEKNEEGKRGNPAQLASKTLIPGENTVFSHSFNSQLLPLKVGGPGVPIHLNPDWYGVRRNSQFS